MKNKAGKYMQMEEAHLNKEMLKLIAREQQNGNSTLNWKIDDLTDLVFFLIQERGAMSNEKEMAFIDEKLLSIKCIRDLLVSLRYQDNEE